MSDRQFDSVTGQPLYTIRGCRHIQACSYPYCSCHVPHDRFSQPLRAKRVINWGSITPFLLLLLLWTVVVYVVILLWPW